MRQRARTHTRSHADPALTIAVYAQATTAADRAAALIANYFTVAP